MERFGRHCCMLLLRSKCALSSALSALVRWLLLRVRALNAQACSLSARILSGEAAQVQEPQQRLFAPTCVLSPVQF